MMTNLIIPQQVSIYMVSTTLIRVLVMLLGLLLVARMTPLKTLSKVVGVVIIATMLILWTPLLIRLGRNNVFRIDENMTFPPPILAGVLLPIIIAYLTFVYWDTWRQMVYNIPQHWLIGIQVFRLTGGMILGLYIRGLLPAEFAISAGVGDIFIGLTALPVAYFYYKKKPWGPKLAVWWNYIGIADFVIAVPLGMLTSPGPIQLLALDNPNFLTTIYPVVLFPTFSVPVGIILHIYSLALLKKEQTTETRESQSTVQQKTAWGILLSFALIASGYTIVFYFISPLVSNRPLGFQIHVELQKTFAQHPVGLYFHIIPSLLALILGPFQFHKELRGKNLKLHRWLGRLYLFGTLFGGLGGLYMALFSFAGPVSRLGFGILAMAWLFTGYKAYQNIRHGHINTHREWMIRNYALTLAAVTLRIYTRSFIGMGYLAPDFHHINAWLCWLPNLLIAEWIVRRTRSKVKQLEQTLSTVESQPG